MDTAIYGYVSSVKAKLQTFVSWNIYIVSGTVLYALITGEFQFAWKFFWMAVILNFLYWVKEIVDRMNSDHPDNFIVVKEEGGVIRKFRKPTYKQMLILGGCIIALFTAIMISYKIKDNMTLEGVNAAEKKRNLLLAQKWEKFKRIAIFIGLFPMTLSKDMEAVTELIKYIVRSYKDAREIHNMWNDVSTFFEADTHVENVVPESFDKATPDEIAKAVAPVLQKIMESKFVTQEQLVSVINDDNQEEEKYEVIPQMYKTPLEQEMHREIAKQIVQGAMADLPGADSDISSEDFTDSTDDEKDEVVASYDAQPLSNRKFEIINGTPSVEMVKIQSLIDKSQTNRHGLGYKGTPRVQLLNKVDNCKKWINRKFNAVTIWCVVQYCAFRDWRFAKHAIVIGVSVATISALAYIIFGYFRVVKYDTKDVKVPEVKGKTKRKKIANMRNRNLIRRIAQQWGGRIPREMYDELKKKFRDDAQLNESEEKLMQLFDKKSNNWKKEAVDATFMGTIDLESAFFKGESDDFPVFVTSVDSSVNTDVSELESKNNKHPKPKKMLVRKKPDANYTCKMCKVSGDHYFFFCPQKKNKWQKKVEQIIKPDIKPEHLQQGSAVSPIPILYCIKGVDKSGQITYSNAYPIANMLAVCRHAISGKNELSLINTGELIKLDVSKAAQSLDIPDMILIPAKTVNKSQTIKMNKGRVYREPKEDEYATLFFMHNNGQLHFVQGQVGKKTVLKSNGIQVELFYWNDSSVEGACIGVYVAKEDGAIIGFHGLGSTNSRAKPLFYPCNDNFVKNVNSVSSKLDVMYADEEGYYEKYKAFVNENALRVEDLKKLNLPARNHVVAEVLTTEVAQTLNLPGRQN